MKLIGKSKSKLVKWELWDRGGGVYVLRVEDQYERGMLFLRYQEYFESPYRGYYRRDFKLLDFMDHYRRALGEGVFSYPGDWGGYNIPGEMVERCMAGVVDWSSYDTEMEQIVSLVEESRYYLIGVDSLDGSLMEHEMAHAFYYLDGSYRKEVNRLVGELDVSKVGRMMELLLGWGYRGRVLRDEMQAYLSTGLVGEQGRIFGKRDCRDLVKNFRAYMGKFGKLGNK